MKRYIKAAVIVVVIAFIVLQFFQIDRSQPEILQGETLEAVVKVPADVQAIIGRSCNDCHSNTTRYPWYSYVQPSGWLLQSHISHGRRHLNFSTFATYDKSRQEKKLEEICEQVSSGEMPLPSYLWIHRDAVLSDSDKQAICDWTKTAIGKP